MAEYLGGYPDHVKHFSTEEGFFWGFEGDTWFRGPYATENEAIDAFLDWASDQYWMSNTGEIG